MKSVSQRESHELKPEQQLAAHTLDRHVSVTAGPGAGKTMVLVERYLHILRTQDISVDQIVAITFTNRAANETRERLRSELDKLLRSADANQRSEWMHHKRTLDGAIITTIHGFCARLLREFPVEADLDPQVSLLDAHQSAMLEEAVVEESLTEFISAGHQAVTELAAGVGRLRLARGLIGIYRSMRNQGLSFDQLRAATDKRHKTAEDLQRGVSKLATKMTEFVRARGLTGVAEAKRRQAELRWPPLLAFLTTVSDSTAAGEFSEAIREFREATRPEARGRIAETIKALDELIWDEKLRCRVPQSFFDLRARPYALELIDAVKTIEQRLDDEKRRRSVLDFDDLQLRTLRLLEAHPEVLRRTGGRYKFFLVDEFQDTNGLQRDLMTKLAFGSTNPGSAGLSPALSQRALVESADETPALSGSVRRSNLFIVGDRKQSIYGFRGANVDVFREMTARIVSQDGLSVPLNRNFRSRPALIRFFNFLFERIFESNEKVMPKLVEECGDETKDEMLNELGYVPYEASAAARQPEDASPLVELLVDLEHDDADDDRSKRTPRERDAEQVASRIISLVGREVHSSIFSLHGSLKAELRTRPIEYRDIALLFRAMTEVHIYESAFRRAGIPYITVDGRGFYAREEITDLIQLLRFLDNKSDEVALAAVLRSPICGLSDDALLALRCAPVRTGMKEGAALRSSKGVRPLLQALNEHEAIDFINEGELPAIERARDLLQELIARARRSRISELLRFAVEASEYRVIAAAHFDGAQRLANIEKLFTLAERFERSGAYLIRDFVRFVHDFEEAGGRESEGQIDESANAIRLMSIHQSKGLEFPVVIIPDLHRQSDNRREWWALDRHRGLTLKVPDGRGNLAAGSTYAEFAERAKLREQFENMRLLYVAATRAEERLILSGAAKDLTSLRGSWLEWISEALELANATDSHVVKPAEGVEAQLTVNLADASREVTAQLGDPGMSQPEMVPRATSDEQFPLLGKLKAERETGLHRFSVTELLNYRRCPRQYYFDRVLRTPSEDQVSLWNDAEAPEPSSTLTATLKGAVIHRFCERFQEGDDLYDLLNSSLREVLRLRAAELGDRVLEINPEKAVRDLLPLAENYVDSNVRERIETARLNAEHGSRITDRSPLGVLSEQRFRLRRPLGILTGTIDKLLIRSSGAAGLNVEIVDFKTNRFRAAKHDDASNQGESPAADERPRATNEQQLSFGFLGTSATVSNRDFLDAQIKAAAADYQIQMQAYALSARELIPQVSHVRATLHFLDPNVELSLADDLVQREACAKAIDDVMTRIVTLSGPESFPAHPGARCRACSFVEFCLPGRGWLTEARL